MSRESVRLVFEALAKERIETANRLWADIEITASTPDNLRENVGISWLALIRIFDRYRKP